MLKRAGSSVTALAAALTVVAATSVACTNAGGAAGTAEPTLTIGSSVAPPSLDPTASAAASITEPLDYNIYQHLVQVNPKGDIVPVLATGYTLSPDRKTYTFTIRPNVKFSNGNPLTADVVVFNFKRVMAPNSTYPNKRAMGTLTAVTKLSESQVSVSLAQPDAEWLYQLAAYSNGVILDPTAVGQISTTPVGTGPYAFSSFKPNYSLTFTRNTHYWGAAPGPKSVVFRYFSAPSAAVSALRSGQIDVIDNLTNSNPIDANQFKNDPGFKVIAGLSTGKVQLSLNNANPQLGNVLVRRAISHALDKKAILQIGGNGYGEIIGSNTVPGDPWYDPALAGAYDYDPAEAKQLLTQAGYPHGFDMSLTLPAYGYAQTLGPLIASQLKAVGINATINTVSWPLWLSKVFSGHGFDATIVNQALAHDLNNYANPKYYWGYPDADQVGRMLAEAKAAPTQPEQISLYRQVLNKLTSDAVNVWLYDPAQITVARKNIVGLPGSGLAASFDLSNVSFGGPLSDDARAQGFSD